MPATSQTLCPKFSHGLLLGLLLSAGCSTNGPSLELQASEATSDWLIRRYGISSDAGVNPMISRVTLKLASTISGAALEENLDRDIASEYRNYPWQVVVLSTDAPNAFSVGAGKIFLTNGLITRLDSESALAAILSHEMAHHLLGHTEEAVEKADEDRSAPTFSFDIEQELEADDLGLRILKVAGYNLHEAAAALSTDYRSGDSDGAAERGSWFTARAANLHQQIELLDGDAPTITSTREFNKVRRGLMERK